MASGTSSRLSRHRRVATRRRRCRTPDALAISIAAHSTSPTKVPPYFSELTVPNLLRQTAFALIVLAFFVTPGLAAEPYQTHYRGVNVDGVRIFYREASNPKAPAILLLHGFPSLSHLYRNLIPLFAA